MVFLISISMLYFLHRPKKSKDRDKNLHLGEKRRLEPDTIQVEGYGAIREQ